MSAAIYAHTDRAKATSEPLLIQDQGSFAVGGVVIARQGTYDPTLDSPDGQTLHGDHAFTTFQVPVGARRYPLVFLHGNQQFSKTWQTTPDGREGFHNIFLRRGFASYLVEKPRRGNAGRSTQPHSLLPTPNDQTWFDNFRVGIWPDYFDGVQFSREPDALDQFFRQITPDTGPFDVAVAASAVTALFERVGPAILVTHSKGGGVGWLTATNTPNVVAIVSYEPGTNFPFPHGDVPEEMPSAAGPLKAEGVPLEQFMALTRIPILIVYGDFIPTEPTPVRGQDMWRVRLAMARRWAETVNRHGGDVSLVCLPDVGIRGNTHFPFSDLNNVQVADQLSTFLRVKGLDQFD